MVPNVFRYILSMGTLGKKEMIIPSLNALKALIFMLLLSRNYVFRVYPSISD